MFVKFAFRLSLVVTAILLMAVAAVAASCARLPVATSISYWLSRSTGWSCDMRSFDVLIEATLIAFVVAMVFAFVSIAKGDDGERPIT